MKIAWMCLISLCLNSLSAASSNGAIKTSSIRNLPLLSSCVAPERNKELSLSLRKFFVHEELPEIRQLIIKKIAPLLLNLQKTTASSKLGPKLKKSAEKYYRTAVAQKKLTPEKLKALRLSLQNISSSQAFSKAQIQKKLLVPLTFLTAVQQGKRQTSFVDFERALRVFISNVDEYMTKIALYQELLKTVKNPKLQKLLKNASGQVLSLSIFANKLRNDTDGILGFVDKSGKVLCSPADYLMALGIGEHDVHSEMQPDSNDNHNPFNNTGNNGMNHGMMMQHDMHPGMGQGTHPMNPTGMMQPPPMQQGRPQMGQPGFNPGMPGRPPMQPSMMPQPQVGQPSFYHGIVGQQSRPPLGQPPVMPQPQAGQPGFYPGIVGQQNRPPMQPPVMQQPQGQLGMIGQLGRPPMQLPMMPQPQVGQPSFYPGIVGQQSRTPMQPPVMQQPQGQSGMIGQLGRPPIQPPMMPQPQVGQPSFYPGIVGQQSRPPMQPPVMQQPQGQPGMIGQMGRPPIQPPMMPQPQAGQPGFYPGIVGQQNRPPMQPPMLQPLIQQPRPQMGQPGMMQQPQGQNAQPPIVCPQPGMNSGAQFSDMNSAMQRMNQGMQQPITCPQPSMNPGMQPGMNPGMNPNMQSGSTQQPVTCSQPNTNQGQGFNGPNAQGGQLDTGRGLRAQSQDFSLDTDTDTDQDTQTDDDEDGDDSLNSQQSTQPDMNLFRQPNQPFNQQGQSANQGMFANTQNQAYAGSGYASNYGAQGAQSGNPTAPTQCIVGAQPGGGQNPYGSYPNGGNQPYDGGLQSQARSISFANSPSTVPVQQPEPASVVTAPAQQSVQAVIAVPMQQPNQASVVAAQAQQSNPVIAVTLADSENSKPLNPDEVKAAEENAAKLAVQSAQAAEQLRKQAAQDIEDSTKRANEEQQKANQLAADAAKKANDEQQKANQLAANAAKAAQEKQIRSEKLEREAQKAIAAIPTSAIDENGIAKVYADADSSAVAGTKQIDRAIEEIEGVQVVYAETTTPILVKRVTHEQAIELQEHATPTATSVSQPTAASAQPIDTNAQQTSPAAATTSAAPKESRITRFKNFFHRKKDTPTAAVTASSTTVTNAQNTANTAATNVQNTANTATTNMKNTASTAASTTANTAVTKASTAATSATNSIFSKATNGFESIFGKK